MRDPRSEDGVFNSRDLHGQLVDCTYYENEVYFILFIWDKERHYMRKTSYYGDEVSNPPERKTNKVFAVCSFLQKESFIFLGRYPVFSA
jgi:hypothetical protein